MTIRRFYSPEPVHDKTLILTGDELFHLRNVNRAKTGDEIEVVNGKGSLYTCEIRKIDKEEALVVVEKEENQPKPALRTIIAPSLIKKKAMTLMIEKLTEIGVDEIRPVLYTRTDEKYSPSHLKKWQRLAVQALKVNKKLWLSDVSPPVSLNEIIKLSQNVKTKLLLDKNGKEIAGRTFTFPAIAIIGPPGDFSKEEKELLLKNDFASYKLNNYILKTETAAISIAAILRTML